MNKRGGEEPITRPGPEAPIQPAPVLPENAPPEEKFEAIFHQLMDGFGAACDAEQVKLALAIALDPTSKRPIIFVRGNNYDLLQLMKYVYVQLRQQLLEEFSL